MELIAKVLYHAGFGTLEVGESTSKYEVPEETKKQMLEDHPEWFEVVKGSSAPVVEKAEEFIVETPEAKEIKTRKKA